jgi:hypothetical protein
MYYHLIKSYQFLRKKILVDTLYIRTCDDIYVLKPIVKSLWQECFDQLQQ